MKQRYFWHNHYDRCYFRRSLPIGEVQIAMMRLFSNVMTWVDAVNEKRVQGHPPRIDGSSTLDLILMSGSLLGWWWHHAPLPWDNDLDMKLAIDSFRMLIEVLNITDTDQGRWTEVFITEDDSAAVSGTDTHEEIGVQPSAPRSFVFSLVANLSDILRQVHAGHRIDCRFIDPSTGVFIDVTVLNRHSLLPYELDFIQQRPTRLPTSTLLQWNQTGQIIRNRALDVFNVAHVFPLQRSTFMGMKVWVPAEPETVLDHWYSPAYRAGGEAGRAASSSNLSSTPQPVYASAAVSLQAQEQSEAHRREKAGFSWDYNQHSPHTTQRYPLLAVQSPENVDRLLNPDNSEGPAFVYTWTKGSL